MGKKIAVAIIHGIGGQEPNFYKPFAKKLIKAFNGELEEKPSSDLVIQPIWWADILEPIESKLLGLTKSRIGRTNFFWLRKFVVQSGGDAIAYQPFADKSSIYEKVHARVAQELHTLAEKAGSDAPLCIIAHSLGTIIISNYFWDLQHHLANEKELIDSETDDHIHKHNPLERGETFAHLYTLGSPIALYSIRFENFGKPFEFPPAQLKDSYPQISPEWINFYSNEDVIAYPLSDLNDDYKKCVTDKWVDVGNALQFWNPISHTLYWTGSEVIKPIAKSLAKTWKALNSSDT